MHTELSSFLTNVWENRELILYSQQSRGTIEDRVYHLFAPKHQVTAAGITQSTYGFQVTSIIRPPGSLWRFVKNDWASNWINGSATRLPSYRVYVKPYPHRAVEVFKRILELSSPAQAAQRAETSVSGGRRLPSNFLNRTVFSTPGSSTRTFPQRAAQLPLGPGNRGALVPASRTPATPAGPADPDTPGYFASVVYAAKIALAQWAFTARSDRIVVYINMTGGREGAKLLAEKIAAFGKFFEYDHPPMSERISSGISIAADVTKEQQKQVDVSFGTVRSALIAWALLEAVTGVPTNAGRHTAPIGEQPLGQRAPTRIDFLRIVQNKFAAHNINVNEPWL